MPRLPSRDARRDGSQSAALNHRVSVCSSRQHAPRKPGALVIGECVFAAQVESSADKKSPIMRDFSEPSQSTRFEPHYHQMWSQLLQPVHAGSGGGTPPLAAPRTTTTDPVRSPQAASRPRRQRRDRVRQLPAETRRSLLPHSYGKTSP